MDSAATRRKEGPTHKNNGEKKTLIFVHIPKTGGTTLKDILRRQFPPDTILDFIGKSPQEVQEYAGSLASLSEKDRLKIRYISQPLFFEFDNYLPEPPIYFTLLRDPVERVISEYYFMIRQPSTVVPKNISFEDYVRSGTWQAWNAQLSFLRGRPEGLRYAGGTAQMSGEDLEVAKENIRKKFILGLTERFDESLILLKRALGWKLMDILYIKQRIGVSRPPRREISDRAVELIKERNKLDIELYQFAMQVFEERISQQDSSFQKEVQNFQSLNRLYGVLIVRVFVLMLALLQGKLRISDFQRYLVHRL
jgi:hypothetical protein